MKEVGASVGFGKRRARRVLFEYNHCGRRWLSAPAATARFGAAGQILRLAQASPFPARSIARRSPASRFDRQRAHADGQVGVPPIVPADANSYRVGELRLNGKLTRALIGVRALSIEAAGANAGRWDRAGNGLACAQPQTSLAGRAKTRSCCWRASASGRPAVFILERTRLARRYRSHARTHPHF